MSELEVKISSYPIPRKWTPQEDADLLLAIKSSSREEVAKQLNRTPNAIVHRLKKVAVRMNKADEIFSKIFETTRLSEKEINEAVKDDAEQTTARLKKKSNKSYATAATGSAGVQALSTESANSLNNVEASLARIEVLLQKILEK